MGTRATLIGHGARGIPHCSRPVPESKRRCSISPARPVPSTKRTGGSSAPPGNGWRMRAGRVLRAAVVPGALW